MDTHLMLVFFPLVAVILLYDLFWGKGGKVSMKKATILTLIYIGLSFVFYGYVYYDTGATKANEFLTAYLIEKALSVDNLFVFIAVFKFFEVPEEYHHKVLSYGIVGALVLRAIFIFSGVWLIELATFEIWGMEVPILIIFFGAFLIYAGVKTFKSDDDEEKDYHGSPGAKFIKWMFGGKVAKDYDGDKFFTKITIKSHDPNKGVDPDGNRHVYTVVKYATPLLVVVGVIEFTDLLFAVDSIPAIFSVSKDPFILYSSNIFAILGLRAMYFLLNNFMGMFTYLGKGLAMILSFIGVKMVISPLYHIGTSWSLGVVIGVLILSVVLSIVFPEKKEAVV